MSGVSAFVGIATNKMQQQLMALNGNSAHDAMILHAAVDFILNGQTPKDPDRLWVVLHLFADQARKSYDF